MRMRALFALVPVSLLAACWNDGHNIQVYGGGNRLQLVIEPDRTGIEGTHFLVDTATGDLWRLQNRGGEIGWARLADGPDDLQPFTLEHLGVPPSDDEADDG